MKFIQLENKYITLDFSKKNKCKILDSNNNYFSYIYYKTNEDIEHINTFINDINNKNLKDTFNILYQFFYDDIKYISKLNKNEYIKFKNKKCNECLNVFNEVNYSINYIIEVIE